jgi:transposase InsO family protein
MAYQADREDGAIFEYIEGLYNTRSRHSSLGHLSPSEFEEVKLEEEDSA